MTDPDVLVRLTCRNCGADLKHRTSNGNTREWLAVLDCTECDATHTLTVRLATHKGVAA